MTLPQLQPALGQLFSQKLKIPITSLHLKSVGGGSINNTYKAIVNNHFPFFIKINSATQFPQLFLKEKASLELIREQHIINVPEVVDCTVIENHQILILNWVNGGERTENFWKKFGQQLAILHAISNEQFGLAEDNYMGSVVQLNKQHNNWVDFFIHQRLQPLVHKSFNQKLLNAKHVQSFENLYTHLPDFFESEPPSLLHGDLWSGNYMCNDAAEPVLIDPAVYYGHRSVDMAMTTLFGGFAPTFYEAYNYHYPFPSNYLEQWKLCNLYPLLIHLLLFGKSYLRQIEETLITYH